MPPEESTNNKVSVTLANPLSAKYAVRHGLEDRDYETLAEIQVDRNSAQALIGAGYVAGVDPEDREAVAAVLDVPVAEVPSTQVSESGTPSGGNQNPDEDPAPGDQVRTSKTAASKTATPPA